MCARLALPLDCFALLKDVNHLDYAEFLHSELGFRDVRRTIAGLIRSAAVVSLIEISIQEYFGRF
jgi:predicted DNA-binding protein with PD1-like motif